MLTKVEDIDVSGINGVEWDAVELPSSQFMENWCYHKKTVMGFAKHYQSGETLPDELFLKLTAARTYRAGSQMLRQLMFGLLDMNLHDGFDPKGQQSIFALQKKVAETASVLPVLDEDRFLCSFSHIFAEVIQLVTIVINGLKS